ncbi:MAG: hypothetical protein UIC65_01955 [Alphaproteobacteria bacterium]|nr:hypothetical protein [Alphaproteobacteria bacterium]
MTQIIAIVENNHVTGVVYGTVNVPDTGTKVPQQHTQTAAKVSKARMQQLRNQRIKQK